MGREYEENNENKEERFKDPNWLETPSMINTQDMVLKGWCKAYSDYIYCVLKTTGLLSDKEAYAYAQNLWYYENMDVRTMQAELEAYKKWKEQQIE